MSRRGARAKRTPIAFASLLAIAFGLAIVAGAHHPDEGGESHQEAEDASPDSPDVISGDACAEGQASSFACSHVELLSWVTRASLGYGQVNDVWGWTDPVTGVEYAILGMQRGTVFVDLSDPTQPVHVASLPTQSLPSIWRSIKVYGNYAFVVSEARFHGMQIFDLRQLAGVTSPPQVFEATAYYDGFTTAHNVVINEATGFAYAVGTTTCAGGLHIVDIRDPLHPAFAGCYSGDGYTHDAQCVVYRGPDVDHQGQQLCFAYNVDALTIVDVTDPGAPIQISSTGYEGYGFTHQGWLSEDQAHLFLDDEFDELGIGGHTRTYVWDVSDLDAPFVTGVYEGVASSIDHNQYVVGDHVFQANYTSGLRILRMGDLAKAELLEVGFFDTHPENDETSFNGLWSVYPFFASGIVIVSDINRGLFVFRPDLDAVPRCNDGLDNDGDGFVDHPEDRGCSELAGTSEAPRNDAQIDIRPRIDFNPIHPKSRGEIPVALLGQADFDVRDVDVATVRFGPRAAAPVQKPRAYLRDVNRDGFTDLVAYFRTQEAGIELKDSQACLAFATFAGVAYEGCDVVNDFPRCGLGAELALIVPPIAWWRTRRRAAASARPAHPPSTL